MLFFFFLWSKGKFFIDKNEREKQTQRQKNQPGVPEKTQTFSFVLLYWT